MKYQILAQKSDLIKKKSQTPVLSSCCHGPSTSVAMEFNFLACRWQHCADTDTGSKFSPSWCPPKGSQGKGMQVLGLILYILFLTVYPCLVFTSLLVTYNSFQLHKDRVVLPTFPSHKRSRQQLNHTSALKIKTNSIPCRDNK